MRALLALLLVLLPASDATAATVAREGSEIVFRAGPGERDRFSVEAVVEESRVRFTKFGDEASTITPGEGCFAEGIVRRPDGTFGQGGDAACDLAGVTEVRILTGDGDDAVTLSGRIVFSVDLGPGDDGLSPAPRVPVPDVEPTAVSVVGGDGRDAIGVHARSATVSGEAGNDFLTADQTTAGGPSVLDGGEGNDFLASIGVQDLRLLGGPGDDRLATLADDAAVAIDCGPGADETVPGFEDRPGAGCAPHLSGLRLRIARRGVVVTAGRVSGPATVKITVRRAGSRTRLASGTLRLQRAGRLRGTLRGRAPRGEVSVSATVTPRGGGGDRETVSYTTRLR